MGVILKGRFTTLRPLEVNDAEITLEWRNGNRAKHLNKGAQSINEQRLWIERSASEGDLNFIIEYKDNPVGMISLYAINNVHNSLIMGRLIIGEPEHVGKVPVAFEAEKLILDYAFDELKMHSVYGDVMATNTGMLKMRRYLHWHKDGIIPEHFCVDGKYVDAVLFSLLKDDYINRCRRILVAAVDMYDE